MTFYSPGQAAEKSGFSLDTLRYYEKIGLLREIGRTSGGRRRFTDDDLNWLGLLRCLRLSGMPITEMLRYSELVRDGEHTYRERIELLEAHDRRVEDQIAELREQQEHIRWKIDLYRTLDRCPIEGPADAVADREDVRPSVAGGLRPVQAEAG